MIGERKGFSEVTQSLIMSTREERWGAIAPMLPAVAQLNPAREEHWSRFDDSVNAVSFGFVATAILISMFLVMAIFERFLRPRSSPSIAHPASDLEAQIIKLHYPSPKMRVCSREVSVVMPGDKTPTFIARPAPPPCPPDHKLKPLRPQAHNHADLNPN